MKKTLIGIILLLSGVVVSAQQYPPYVLYTLVDGVPTAATGTGAVYPGGNPPPFLCYGLNAQNQPAPCDFTGGGTTTNALTAAASGGAAPGSTFNGSAAVTWDYHTLGAAAANAIPLVCADTSGSGTAQVCNTSPTFTPAANDCIIYTTTSANSGTGLTLNVNSLGAKSVAKWLGSTTLAAGDVAAGEGQLACYNGTVWNLSTIGNAPAGTYTLPSQYKTWSCQTGIGDGYNAIPSQTYLQSFCLNTTGVSVTITGVKCYTDGGTPTLNAAGNTLGALLTGAVTCTTSFAAGTQSSNVTLTNGDWINFTFVAGGTAKQTTWVVTGTY